MRPVNPTQNDACRGKTAVEATELGGGDDAEPLLGDTFESEKRRDVQANRDLCDDEVLVAS
ncbi:hypothetical protein ACE6H2_000585 [Prunus campanulata]